jgi:alkanesulfonate monooxygenase SsuD/methylene tetrahydromethanopterin reductase-like flavin-dependent oxidoreductase (luciferase family)
VSEVAARPLVSARSGGPEFGLYLPQTRMTFGAIEEKVRLAEGLGFHSVWLMDHLAAPATPEADTFEALTLTAALASRTTKIRLGQMCLNAHFRSPAVLAKEAATIDVISGGRLELGLGWGSSPDELTTFGLGHDDKLERVRKLVETIEILRLMFAGEPFSYRGTHHQLEGAVGRPTPVQPRVPIHVGGADRRLTIPLARKYADWWNCPSYAADRLPQLLPGLNGRTRVSVQHVVGLAAGRSQREVTRHEAERRFGGWGGLITGTASEVAAVLIEEAQLGVDLFILQFSDFATPRTLKLFAREVVPVVRQAMERRA